MIAHMFYGNQLSCNYNPVKDWVEQMSQTPSSNQLGQYLHRLMQVEGIGSVRAFATHYNLPRMTVQRIMDGQRVDPESLNQIAEALHVSPELLFRLSGYLPSSETRNLLLDELEAVLRKLSPEDQRRLRDMVLEEAHRLLSIHDEQTSSTPLISANSPPDQS